MVFRFCPQCGKEPLAHNAMRESEYSCPDCKGEFFIDLLSALLGGDPPETTAVDAVFAEASPQEALATATAELEEVADFELSAESDMPPKIDDGGPAFPVLEDVEYLECHTLDLKHPGMSLRDWFAGQALQGALANPHYGRSASMRTQFARDSYSMADVMLAQRTKRKEPRHG